MSPTSCARAAAHHSRVRPFAATRNATKDVLVEGARSEHAGAVRTASREAAAGGLKLTSLFNEHAHAEFARICRAVDCR